MSILIKGMEKPKSCDDCIVPLSRCDFLQRRADECPIIEIPTPHGRLIDRDEIYISRWDIDTDLAEQIQNAPTILEAEE